MEIEEFGLIKKVDFSCIRSDILRQYIPDFVGMFVEEDMLDILTKKYIITIDFLANRYIGNIYKKADNDPKSRLIQDNNILRKITVVNIDYFHSFLELLYDALVTLDRESCI